MQLLELSQRHALPDIDVYITTDDWPQVSQQNVSAACPQQGPLLCQVNRSGAGQVAHRCSQPAVKT